MLSRRKMHLTVGTSELDGFDVGKYPLHHFVPGPGCGGELRNRLPVYIRSAGRDEWVKGCFRHRRNSDIFAVEFVVSGEFAFTRHGRRHLIGPGGIFLGHPDGGESCMEVTSDYAEKRTVIIRGAALEGVTGALNLDEVDLLRPAAPEEFNRWLDRADAFCPNGDPHEASAFTYEFLLYLSKLAGRAGLSVEIQQAQDYLRARLDRPLRLEELCRALALSPASVYRLFARELGTTPIEYHAKLRTERAAEILASGSHSVKEVAAMLGYSSPQYFATEFRKRRGFSPSCRHSD